jgi:hypothetical protein
MAKSTFAGKIRDERRGLEANPNDSFQHRHFFTHLNTIPDSSAELPIDPDKIAVPSHFKQTGIRSVFEPFRCFPKSKSV